MSRQVVLADDALDDMAAAADWLFQPGAGETAAKRWNQLSRAIDADLCETPCRWPEGDHPGVRERTVAGGYRIMYEVDPDTDDDATAGDVQVLRVYAPRQDRSGFVR